MGAATGRFRRGAGGEKQRDEELSLEIVDEIFILACKEIASRHWSHEGGPSASYLVTLLDGKGADYMNVRYNEAELSFQREEKVDALV
eukprot:747567-Hanusia_phi.AAC.5